jgi:hypothetical protein
MEREGGSTLSRAQEKEREGDPTTSRTELRSRKETEDLPSQGLGKRRRRRRSYHLKN